MSSSDPPDIGPEYRAPLHASSSRPLGGSPSEGALGPYIRAVAAHKLVVLLVTVVCTAAAVVAVSLRTARYQATAEMIVNPVPAGDTIFVGLPVISDTGDPVRTAQTAATIVATQGAATRLALRLPGWTPRRIASAVSVKPAGQSNVLAVTGTADSPALARRLANGYARAVLATRRAHIAAAIDALLPQLHAQQSAPINGGGAAAADLAARINELQAVRNQGDPSISFLAPAAGSTTAGTSRKVIVVLAIFAGLVLGCGAALLLEMMSTKVRDEEEALAVYPLPVLARIPRVSARSRADVLAEPRVRDAFQNVLMELMTLGTAGRAVMVTGASRGDGKTVAATSLAMAVAGSGHSGILMDLDVRHPETLRTLGMSGEQPEHNAPLMNGSAATSLSLDDFLVPVPDVPNLSVFALALGDSTDGALLAEIVRRRLRVLLREALTRSEWVVIDTAPLGEVSDALPIAAVASEILLVVRLRHTDRRALARAREQLERVGARPLGMLVLDDRQPMRRYYGREKHVRRAATQERVQARNQGARV
jgi:Mrp family chromosome partitioning ATPase